MIRLNEFRAMGCHTLAAIDTQAELGDMLLDKAPEWFETWEAKLSRFRPDSELNRLNRSQGRLTPVSAVLWNVLQAALNAYEKSGGLVTPAVLDALEAAGYTDTFDHIEPLQRDDGRVPHPVPGLEGLEMRLVSHSVRLPLGIRLDLGGVGKGWAAHNAMRRLEEFGPSFVDAGGDIAISSCKKNGDPWLVAIDDPRAPGDNLGTLRLGRCGVATSGKDYRRWRKNGAWQHHIINPRTGRPADTDVLTATVVAPNVMDAEMAAKTVLIMGCQEGLDWLQSQPGYSALVVTDDGSLVATPSLQILAEQKYRVSLETANQYASR